MVVLALAGVAFVVAVGYLAFATSHKQIAMKNSELTKQNTAFSGAVLKTTQGDIEITFLSAGAPVTVNNFITLAEKSFYTDTKFHRVVKGFIIQGGDPLSRGPDRSIYGRGGPGYVFDNEVNTQKMIRGKVAMANYGPNTNGSQFFILTRKEAPSLEGQHTIFAEVTKGMDVVDAINAVAVDKNNVPIVDVVLQDIILK